MAPGPRGRRAHRPDDKRTSPARPKKHPAEAEADKLRRKVEHLEKEVAMRDAALEVLGETHALLELLSESADTDPRSTQ